MGELRRVSRCWGRTGGRRGGAGLGFGHNGLHDAHRYSSLDRLTAVPVRDVTRRLTPGVLLRGCGLPGCGPDAETGAAPDSLVAVRETEFFNAEEDETPRRIGELGRRG